ncbi:MAG: hypothetical protein CSA22_00335 [Deltaproteobacteria bacterium]|nr:MAG: hypothetical protein CSA22_00335 [Deltaproteobacteria bacterium]
MLDTCGLIWLVNGGGRLSAKTSEAIQAADIVYVSAATALEIGCKAARKKMTCPLKQKIGIIKPLRFMISWRSL